MKMERKTPSGTAIDDTTCSLSTLRARAGKPMRDVILEIHEQQWKPNDKSIGFLKNLKCFLPTTTASGGRPLHHGKGRPVETLLRPCSQVKNYVALSYPWNPSYSESTDMGGYRLPEGTVPVRNIVLDRTIRFIRYKQGRRGMIPFWIDQLSIDQKNTPEREKAMQSMDLVYKGCEFAVGYLWAEVTTQLQMDRLSSLLGGHIVEEKAEGQWPTLKEGVDAQTSDDILDLLGQITDDQWWSRAWIFQEDYIAGQKMWLLIRHAQELTKPCTGNALGSLSGELVVKSAQFRKYATLFCLALQEQDRRPFVVNTCKKVLWRAGKYNLLHKYGHGGQSTMTIRVLKDLNQRNISVPSDLLTISANVCGYDVRILAANNTLKTSLSLGILTLCMSNGEIISNDDGETALYANIFDFLEDRTMSISAPLPDGELTFIKHSRFSVSHLSITGIHTEGVLWKLSDPIHPKYLRQSSLFTHEKPSQRDIYRNGLDDYQRSRLFDLVRVLYRRNERRYKRLANDLERYLAVHDRSVKRDDWPPRFTMDEMAAYLVDAMDAGKYLQVARIVSGSSGADHDTSYRAVFARDRNEIQRTGPTYIFTSWARTNEMIQDEVKCHTLAKYVSMEVSLDRKVKGQVQGLTSKRWTNGLCFFWGEIKTPFVFAWPKFLCE